MKYNESLKWEYVSTLMGKSIEAMDKEIEDNIYNNTGFYANISRSNESFWRNIPNFLKDESDEVVEVSFD